MSDHIILIIRLKGLNWVDLFYDIGRQFSANFHQAMAMIDKACLQSTLRILVRGDVADLAEIISPKAGQPLTSTTCVYMMRSIHIIQGAILCEPTLS